MWIEIILEEQTSTCKRGTETLLFPNDSTCPEGTASAHEVALAPACFAFAWAPFQGAVEEPGFVIRFPSGRFPAHVSTHSHFWSLRQNFVRGLHRSVSGTPMPTNTSVIYTHSCAAKLTAACSRGGAAPAMHNCWTAGELAKKPLLCPVDTGAASDMEEEISVPDLTRNSSPRVPVCLASPTRLLVSGFNNPLLLQFP